MIDWIDLEGKVVIVTGGSMGIGETIVKGLIQNNAKVAIFDLIENTELNASPDVFYVHCDITKKDSVTTSVKKVFEKYGVIDALVNNAGVNKPNLLVDYYNGDPEHEMSEEELLLMFDVNQKGPYLCAQTVSRYYIAQKSGVIVNISSEAGKEGSKGQSGYSSTKGALNSFTLSWAKELGAFNVRVVGVEPGINVPTPMGNPEHVKKLAYTRGIDPSNVENDYTKIIPLGRVGELSEVADLVQYLISDHASYINGTIINVTGGKSRG